MNLYEIDSRIMQIMQNLEPDEETGQIPDNYEALDAELGALQMQQQEILSFLAKYVLNLRSDVTSLKAEEQRLNQKRKSLEGKAERIMECIDRHCAGKKTELGVCTVSYRKTESVDITDYQTAIKCLMDNGLTDCYKIAEPEISKTAVKALIKGGMIIEGIGLKEGLSCSLR